ncbi:DoxX family protein [Allosalinactinospora lopnorensis]|uniref:DoxX family protein n=1 Tax=Allosalinactinospora lopnorensis TaxID=1352348 RepID=UPI000623CC44|nr:DoxX family protein [Allosalinactinospora lopnorensis]
MTQQRRPDDRVAGDESAGGARGRVMGIVLWVLQLVLAVFFAVASAFPKLTAHSSAVEAFDLIGYGDWFMYLIGVLELAGAIGLLIPILSGVTALAFIGLMAGAFLYQVTVFDGQFWFTPIILLVVFAFIAWGRRDRTAQLAARLTGRG